MCIKGALDRPSFSSPSPSFRMPVGHKGIQANNTCTGPHPLHYPPLSLTSAYACRSAPKTSRPTPALPHGGTGRVSAPLTCPLRLTHPGWQTS